MTVEGRICLDMEEIKRAIAEFVGRAHGIEVPSDKVYVLPGTSFSSYGFSAYVEAPVTVVTS